MTKIAVLIGSLREKSYNKALAKTLESYVSEGIQFDYVNINLPLYNEDVEAAGMPPEVKKAKEVIEMADGVLLVTPEYNRSVPGVLKNAIDWTSRPYGQSSYANKPVGIVGASGGPIGTAVAQSDLRHIMLFQGAKVLGQPEVYVMNAREVFDEDGNVTSERWLKNFQQFMDTFARWVVSEK